MSDTSTAAIDAGATTFETIAVVGAGVVGLCTALQAQRKGYRVTLIDRDAPGKGASFGNAGYLATELIDPLSSGKTLRTGVGVDSWCARRTLRACRSAVRKCTHRR